MENTQAETLVTNSPGTAVAMSNPAPVTVLKKAYITNQLQKMMADFQAVNEGVDVDFVRAGKWLVISKTGKLVERDTKGTDDEVNYGDSIDVVIATGEKLWSLWGKKESKYDSVLIVGEREQEDAIRAFREWANANQEDAAEYSEEDIELRYRALVVPIDSIKPGEYPTIYLMSFSPTSTYSYGKWILDLFVKGDKKAGVPKNTGVNSIVTRLTVKEQKSGKNEWLGLTFEAVGMFNPADFGLTEE